MLIFLGMVLVPLACIYALGCVTACQNYEHYSGPNGQVCTRIRKHKSRRA